MLRKIIMRISDEMRKYFSDEVKKIEPSARVYLFGSRVYDEKRGGDIDIMVMAQGKLEFEELSRLRIGFWERFGERKVDFVCYMFDENDPFKELIMEHAVEI